MVKTNESNEIRITRVYDAPVKTVWDAWTDPKQAAQWWGPRGFTITTHSKELKVGGHWSYTMHGPDGVDYPNTTKYLEVEKHKKLVYDHGASDDRPPMFRVQVLFSDVEGKTKMDMTMILPTPEAAQNTRKFVKKAGGDATWDRLGEYLAKEGTGKELFVINRSFDAPIDVMFEMWTNPRHFSQWLPPTGFNMEFLRSDIKQGGSAFFVMTAGSMKMYARASYLKIEKPGCIVYTQQFCDEKEQISRHPMAPVWPETLLTTVKLSEEGPERTRVTVTMEPHGATTQAELAAFIKEKAGMTQGWTGSFDKLEELVQR
jgi:uncharacterized protein YndB with AHSA1/START domain